MNKVRGYRAITNELFAVADGVTTMWPLMVAGKPVRNVRGKPTIWQEDWQGRVELSSQPRTNLALQSADPITWNAGSATVTANGDITLGNDVFHSVRVASGGGSFNGPWTTFSVESGKTYILSWLISAGTSGQAQLVAWSVGNGTSVINGTIVSLSEAGQSAGALSLIDQTEVSPGVWLVRGRFVSAYTDTGMHLLAGPYSAVVGEDVVVLGAWAEQSTAPGAYIPTTTAPATVTDYTYTAPTASIITPEPLPQGTKLFWSGEVYYDIVPSLLPPNATNAERALEGAMARAFDIPTPAREVWDPDTCPVDLLPWLAWALSIDAWKSYWPEHIKRSRIRSAIEIQRRKGTAASVRGVVESFGGGVVLREWHQQNPPGDPYTFGMVLALSGNDGATATAEFVDDVIAEVTRTKPVRAHFTFTQGVEAAGAIGVAAGARACICRRLNFEG